MRNLIAIIGGTGGLGQGLTGRLALAGREVVIGSRDEEKAKRVASELSDQIDVKISGKGNLEATKNSEIVFLSIPNSAIGDIVNQIKPGLNPGNILVSVVVPVSKENERFTIEKTDSNSAAERIDLLSPKEVSTVSGFQVVPAKRLRNFGEPVGSDIPVCGDRKKAKKTIMDIIEKIPGARPIDAGSLANSELIEAAAAFLVELTRIHKNEVSVKFEGI